MRVVVATITEATYELLTLKLPMLNLSRKGGQTRHQSQKDLASSLYKYHVFNIHTQVGFTCSSTTGV